MDTCSHSCRDGSSCSVVGGLSLLEREHGESGHLYCHCFCRFDNGSPTSVARLRLWFDLVGLFVLHLVLILCLPGFLDSHSIRLTWVLALPFVAVEFLLFLGLLWRRNVSHSSR